MSVVLGIDTSSTDLSIGLFRNGQPMAPYSLLIQNSHAEHITQSMTMCLHANGLRPGDITHIAIAAGPGSFTGLRIGFAFVKGFCISSDTKVLPVSSLAVLAHGALGRARTAVAAIDARRSEVFWARFRIEAAQVLREIPDTVGTESDFRKFLNPGDAVVTDTLGYAHSKVFEFLVDRPDIVALERIPFDRGHCCAAVGAAALFDGSQWKNASEVLPEYLRPFSSPSTPKRRGMS
ncbi:MAG: tRNA (adenosine(37)-N6)-threonylcarbamoyltransferase complex dimerization subunit type 1 TsaB [Chitinispirillaceae bacterium]|jgi:tRNA threonylcarbamoyladenosine biosynthesis protein TsaB